MHRVHGEVQLSPRVRALLDDYRKSCGLRDPLPGFLWGTGTGHPVPCLMTGMYERGQIPDTYPFYLVSSEDGDEFIVVQEELYNRLRGWTIDLDDDRRLVIR